MAKKLPYIKIHVELSTDPQAGASSIGVSIIDAKTNKPISTAQYPKYKDIGLYENQKYKVNDLSGKSGMHPAKTLLKQAANYVESAYNDSSGLTELKTIGKWDGEIDEWFKDYLILGGSWDENTVTGDIQLQNAKKLDTVDLEDLEEVPEGEAAAGLSPATHVYYSPVIDGSFVSMKAYRYDGQGIVLNISRERAESAGIDAKYGSLPDDNGSTKQSAVQDVLVNLSKFADLDTSDPDSIASYSSELVSVQIPSGTRFIVGKKTFGKSASGLSSVVVYDPDGEYGNDGMRLVVASCDLTPIEDIDERPLVVDALPGSPDMRFPDWRDLDSCQPFKNESLPEGPEYWITVRTAFEDATAEDMPERMREATIVGIDRLLSFYNKVWWPPGGTEDAKIAPANQIMDWGVFVGLPFFEYSTMAENAYNSMASDLAMNTYGSTAVWETLASNPTSQGHDWRSWHFDPGGVNEEGESFGGQLSFLVRIPAAYLDACPSSTDSFDYDRCGYTRSITFETKNLMADVQQAATIMKSKHASMKASETHEVRPYVDMRKEAERLENFVKRGLKGLLKSNGVSTGIIGAGGIEPEETEYLIELGLDDEYSIKFAVIAEKDKLEIPLDKANKVVTIGDYKGAVPLLNGFQCFADQFSPTTTAYFFYHQNMIGKPGVQQLQSNHWTDFVLSFTYPVPHIYKTTNPTMLTGIRHDPIEGSGEDVQPFFKDLAPHLRTTTEAEREVAELDDDRKKDKLKETLAFIEDVGNFRPSLFIADAFETKLPLLYADSEYVTEIDFVYDMVINNTGVQTLAAKLAHCMLLDMTLNEILEHLCRKALEEADYDTLKEILLNSPWSVAIQQLINDLAVQAGHAMAMNQQLEQNATAQLESFKIQEEALQNAKASYTNYPSPESFTVLCEQEKLYKDSLAKTNVALGAQFFGTAPLAEAGLKIVEYKEILINVIRDLPEYVCKDIIGKLAKAIEWIDALMDTDWEKVFDGLPDELTFDFPKIMIGDLIAMIKEALKEALLKTIAMILITLIRVLLRNLIRLCNYIRSLFDRDQKADLGELIQPEMIPKAMSLFGGDECKDLTEQQLVSAMYDLFDDISVLLTAPEICALLDGTADPKLLDMIVNLIKKRHEMLTGCLPTKDKVEDLLAVLSSMLDMDVCMTLAEQHKSIEPDGEYDGFCPPEFKEALACGTISPELCDEQIKNLKEDTQNSLAELAKLMESPDEPIIMPLPLCGATSPTGASNVNYSNLINPYELEPVSYMVGEILGTMFLPTRKSFNSDLANFLPAVTVLDYSVYDTEGEDPTGVAMYDAEMFTNLNTLDLGDPSSIEKLKKAADATKLNNTVAPSLRYSLSQSDNFKALSNVEFQNLSKFDMPMLDSVPVMNVLELKSITEFPLTPSMKTIIGTSDDVLTSGMRMFCLYPRTGLAAGKRDPYIIFIIDSNNNLLFADIGDGDESLFKEQVFAYSNGTPLNTTLADQAAGAGDSSTVAFADAGQIIADADTESALAALVGVLGNQAAGKNINFDDMEENLLGTASPQGVVFADLLYSNWEKYGMTKQYVNPPPPYKNGFPPIDDTELDITDLKDEEKKKMAVAFASEFNMANQYALRVIAKRIGDSELFNKRELERFARALVLEVPCADDEPDIKSSLLDLPEIIKKIDEKMRRLACVPGAIEDRNNPPLKRASIEGVIRLLMRVIVVELYLRGIFVLTKFQMNEIYSNVFFLQYVANQAMQEMDESFESGVKDMFLRWVQKTMDDRKALKDPFINPFGPQAINEETGEKPIFVKIETVQDAVGYIAMEQMKIVSDQLEEVITDTFGERPTVNTTPKKQFLNMLRFGPPSVSDEGDVYIPNSVNYMDIGLTNYVDFKNSGLEDFIQLSDRNRFVKGKLVKIHGAGAGLTKETYDTLGKSDPYIQMLLWAEGRNFGEKWVGGVTEEMLAGADPNAALSVTIDSEEEEGYVTQVIGDILKPIGRELTEGGFIIERYIRHDMETINFPGLSINSENPDVIALQESALKVPGSKLGKMNIDDLMTYLKSVVTDRDASLLDIPYNLAIGAKQPFSYGLRLSYVSPISSDYSSTDMPFYNSIINASANWGTTYGEYGEFIGGNANLPISKAFRYTEYIEYIEFYLDPDRPPEILEVEGFDIPVLDEEGNVQLDHEARLAGASGLADIVRKPVPLEIYIHPIAETEIEIPFSGNTLGNFDEFAVHEDKLFDQLMATSEYKELTKSINMSRLASMLGIYTIFSFRNNKHMDKLFFNTKSALKSLFRTLLTDDYKANPSGAKGDGNPHGGPAFAIGGFPFNLLALMAMTPMQILRGLVELTDPGYLRYKGQARLHPNGPTGVYEPPQPPPKNLLGEFGETMTTITTPDSWYRYNSGSSMKEAYDFDFGFNLSFSLRDTDFSFPWTPWGWLLTFVDFKWWDDLMDLFNDDDAKCLPPAEGEDPNEATEEIQPTVQNVVDFILNSDPLDPMAFGVQPCMRFDEVGLSRCKEDGYLGDNSWPSIEPLEFSSFEITTDDGIITAESTTLEACHQFLILKRFYEAFIPTIAVYDKDGSSMAMGMVYRLLDVINKADELNCVSEVPQLAGGIGEFWKQMTKEEILEFFRIKSLDPMLVMEEQQYYGNMVNLYGTYVRDYRWDGAASGFEIGHAWTVPQYIEALVATGLSQKEANEILHEAATIDYGDDYDDPQAQTVLKSDDIYKVITEDKKIDITLDWPPAGVENITGLLALWRFYNAVCLEFAGEDDYHGLLRGRGFIAAIGRTGYGGHGDLFQFYGDRGEIKSAFNSFWKSSDYNLASDGIQNSVKQSTMLLSCAPWQSRAAEDLNVAKGNIDLGPGNSLDTLEVVFINDLGPDGTYNLQNEDNIFDIGFSDHGWTWESKRTMVATMFQDIAHAFGLGNTVFASNDEDGVAWDFTYTKDSDGNLLEIGIVDEVKADKIQDLFMNLGRNWRFEVKRMDDLEKFRNAIRRLWEVEEKIMEFSNIDIELYGDSTPALLQDEKKITNWSGAGKWVPFLSKYFDNPTTGVRDLERLGTICGILPYFEEDKTSSSPRIYHTDAVRSGYLDNWIVEKYRTDYDEIIDSVTQTDEELIEALGEPNKNYPPNVYGPDTNGWLWKRDSSGYYEKYPSDPSSPGYDPYQPSVLNYDPPTGGGGYSN